MKNIIKKFPQTVAVLAAIAAIFLFFGSREGTVPPSQKSSSAGGTDLNGQWSLKFWPQPDTGALALQIQEVVRLYENSTSWRITKPLRTLKSWFDRVFRKRRRP